MDYGNTVVPIAGESENDKKSLSFSIRIVSVFVIGFVLIVVLVVVYILFISKLNPISFAESKVKNKVVNTQDDDLSDNTSSNSEERVYGKNILYPIKTPLKYVPDEYGTQPAYYVLITALSDIDIYVQPPHGGKLYFGNNRNEYLKYNLKNIEEMKRITTIGGTFPKLPLQMILSPQGEEIYTFEFNSTSSAIKTLEIKYGFGDDQNTFFLTKFDLDNQNLDEMRFTMSVQGISVAKEFLPDVFNSDNNPVDVSEPDIDMEMINNKIEVTATDDHVIRSIKCQVSAKGQEMYADENAINYVTPIAIDPTIQTLVCKATDDSGNYAYMFSPK